MEEHHETAPASEDPREAQHRLVAQSGLFDPVHYRLAWPDLASDADLIEHYLAGGWESSNPGPAFDGLYYLDANDDVRAAGLNPLIHYLISGRSERRRATPPRQIKGQTHVPPPRAPSREEWRRLRAERAIDAGAPLVDVVTPVYRDLNQTMRCLFSVLQAAQRTPFRLVVVDDCSPEPDLSAELDHLASEGLIELHRNDENLGFVGACNLAMGLHEERDIVLLNADTEVFGDWLDRLRTAAYSQDRIATVTPFSNNAEICSYPHFVQDNFWTLELADAELDALAAQVNAGQVAPIPTGVGFCLYIRRDCLSQVGGFDQETFGKGYGEESDLCRRAADKGWLHVLAPNVFVRHYGGTSFGESKRARVAAASRAMERLHPGYSQLVGDFIREDPLRPYRTALDVARAARLSRGAPRGSLLLITHTWGGGVERHVQEMGRLAAAAGAQVLIGRPSEGDDDVIALEGFGRADLPNLPPLRVQDTVHRAAAQIRALGVSHVHLHSLAGFGEQVSDFIRAALAMAEISFDITVHDYMAICPRITLIDRSELYCGEPDLAACEACIATSGSPFGRPNVAEWRLRHARLLRQARRIFVPSEDAAQRLRAHFPDVAYCVRRHPEPPVPIPEAASRATSARRRVALLGALWPHKGSRLAADVVQAARAHDLPLDFVVVGSSDRDREFLDLGVEITGPYEEGDGARLLNAVNADLVLFASVCPETYSFTLSEAFAARKPPVAFDFGAIAERVRQAGYGHLMPIDLLLDPLGVAVTLAELQVAPAQPNFGPAQYRDLFADYYELA